MTPETPAGTAASADAATFQSLLSSSAGYLGVLDAEGRWLYVNAATMHEWGVVAESLPGLPFWESPWWQEHEEAREHAREVFRGLDSLDASSGSPHVDAMVSGELRTIRLTKPRGDAAHGLTLVEVFARPSEPYSIEQLSELLQQSGIEESSILSDRLSESLSRIVLKNFPNGVVVLFDRNLRYRFAEGAGLATSGLTREMLVGRTIHEAWPSGIASAIQPQYMAVLEGENVDLDVVYGDSLVSTHGIPITDDHGNVIAGLILTQDATERQLATEARRASETRYRLLFEQHPSPMWIFDTHTLQILAVNDAAISHYGWSRSEFLKMTIRDVRPRSDVPYLAPLLSGVRRGRTVVPGVIRHVRKDGSLLEVEVTSHGLTWQDRDARLVLITDVTEHARNRAEQARLATIIESSDDAIVSMDADATIVTWNRGAERMFGYTHREIVGTSMLELIPEERRTEESGLLARAYAGEAVPHLESERIHRNGSRIPVAIALSTLPDAAGTAVGVSAIIRDMSTRRVLEEQLRQAQRMEAVGRLAGGIAHDFNNLLTAIEGHTGFILDDLPGDHPSRADAEEIRAAVKRASSLTRQLLAFGRKQVMQLRVVDAAAVVNDVQRLLRRVIGEDIELVTRSAGNANVRADPGQLEQVLLNLAVNARDAMPQGGVLVVNSRVVPVSEIASRTTLPPDLESDSMVLISVTDTGVGMEAAAVARAFEPFFTTKPPGKGTGLGLAMVYGIISQSGGTVWLNSNPGRGTTVNVALPAVPEPPVQPVTRSTTPVVMPTVDQGGATILVVEDEPAVRTTLHRLLANHGYHVIEGSNGVEAINVWRHARSRGVTVACVVTDIVMPGMGGRELARVLRAEQPDLPIMFMSGYVADHTQAALTADVQRDARMRFVSKPFRSNEVLEGIRQLLAINSAGEHDTGVFEPG